MSTQVAGSSAGAADHGSHGGRTIGDILLGRGVISEEQLGKALARQQKSGKPLGQILVEDSAITRMELASALAEQWGDVDSVADGWAPLSPAGGQQLPELPEMGMIDAATVFAFREAVDARLGAVEHSLQDVQWRDELIAGAQALAARLESVQGELQDLRGRDDSAFLTQLRDGITALSARLDGTVTEEVIAARLQEVSAVGRAAAERLDELEAQLGSLTSGLASLDGRGGDLASGVMALTERVEELAAGVAGAAEQSAARTDEIEASVLALAERAASSADQDAVADVTARLEELAARLATAATAASVDELRAAVGALAERETADEVSRKEVASLAERVADVRSLSETLQQRVHEAVTGSSSSAESVSRLGEAMIEVRSVVEQLEGREVSDGAAHERIDELTTRVESLGTLLSGDNEMASRIDEVATRLSALAALSERSGVETDLEAVRAQVKAIDSEVQSGAARLARVDEFAVRLGALETRTSEDPRVDELAARIDALAAAPVAAGGDDIEVLRQALADLATRVESLGTTENSGLGLRLDELAAKLDAVGAGAPQVDTAAFDALAARLEALLARVDDLAETQAAAPVDGAGAAADSVAFESFREEISTRVDEAQKLVSEVAGALAGWNEERVTLERRLDDAAARLEAAPAGEGAPTRTPRSVGEAVAAAGTDQEVERLRMTVERLMHDFTEHQRAVKAIASKDFASRMEELEERIRDVAAGGGGGGGGGGMSTAELAELRGELRSVVRRLDDADDSLRKQKDSVFDRIEKMMSSIDWRLQRLEAPAD